MEIGNNAKGRSSAHGGGGGISKRGAASSETPKGKEIGISLLKERDIKANIRRVKETSLNGDSRELTGGLGAVSPSLS